MILFDEKKITVFQVLFLQPLFWWNKAKKVKMSVE